MIKSSFLLTILLSFFASSSINAQSYSKPNRIFKKGQADVQFGIGLTGTFVADKAAMTSIPLSLSFDYMLAKKI